MGGGQRNAEKIEDWVDGIRPDLLLLQELWELELQTQRWVHKYEVVEGVKGIGQGLAVAVATHLMSPKGELRVLMDVPNVLLAGFQSVAGTLWVVGSVHLRPKSSYKEKMDRLKEIVATLEVVRPAGVLLGGDWNSQLHLERSVLATFVRTSKAWERMGFQSLGESEITHRVRRGDQEHTSAIDHCFVAGDLGQQATRELVHGVGSHRAQLVTMSLSSKFGSPFGWKRYP